jgi:pimeloyl-ACP methyl ester carboxylesterase
MTTQRRYVEVEPGVELYVEETGCGRPLLFVPGWTMTTEVFARQVPHFADRYRVVSFDPRCHGRSTATLNGVSYAQQGRDLARLIALLELERPVLLPWSNGCIAVWEMVRQLGHENLAGVVWIDMSPQQIGREPGDWCEGFPDELAALQRTLADRHRAATREFCAGMWQGTPPEAELDWVADQSMKTPHYAALLLAADGVSRDQVDVAVAMDGKLPMLHVVHEKKAAAARAFCKRRTPATPVAALGFHVMFWQHADRFNALVDGFLAEHGL